MKYPFDELNRRSVLKASAAGLGSVFVMSSSAVGSSDERPEEVRKIQINIPTGQNSNEVSAARTGTGLSKEQIANVESKTDGLAKLDQNIRGLADINSIDVTVYDDARYTVDASGTQSIEDGLQGFTVELDSPGREEEFSPDEAMVSVRRLSNSSVRMSEPEQNGPVTGDEDYSDQGISIQDSDSGEDSVRNFEGGVMSRVEYDAGFYYPDCKAAHRQTYEWDSSSGNVNSWSGEYCTNTVQYNGYSWDHEGSGWEERDSSGDDYYSESFSQYTKGPQYDRSQLYTSMTMEPDGQFSWSGRVEITSNYTSTFEMYSSYYDTEC